MTALSPLERKALKARAHHLNPVVLIGDAGLTPAVMREIDLAIKSHELIKVRMMGDDRDARTAAYESICGELHCAPVQHIGKLMVLYRPKPVDPAAAAAALRSRRPAGPRRTKKQLAQQATGKPAGKSVGRPGVRSAGKSAGKSAGRPASKSVLKSAGKLAGRPSRKPAGRPFGDTASRATPLFRPRIKRRAFEIVASRRRTW